MAASVPDYYEFLQISPHAEADTIHRVYRFLAARLHPDNRELGNAESFQLLKAAYDVLSNPKRRAEYDAARGSLEPPPLSSSIDFMDDIEGEANRRLAVLAVLYSRRRGNPNHPAVSLIDIETRMGFPRDYLDFTLWYLQKKGFISKADNAQYELTVDGVDYVETEQRRQPTLNRLLTSGARASIADGAAPPANGAAAHATAPAAEPPAHVSGDGNAHPAAAHAAEKRGRKLDRREGATDARAIKAERRFHATDRRQNPAAQHAAG